MSEEQINTAIAEACGFTQEEPCLNGHTCWRHEAYPTHFRFYAIPDFCNDLNAMHEAEEYLRGHQYQRYAEMLDDIIGSVGGIRATARERAEAFLRTIGKWKEAAK